MRITHPFHPLRGQIYRLLKTRRIASEDTVILQGTDAGTFAVPRDWTDRADVAVVHDLAAPVLSFPRLLELAEFLAGLGVERDPQGGLTDG